MIADTLSYFESRRAKIVGALEGIAPASDAAREPLRRILEFCVRGKMIRGCLVFLGAEAARSSAGAAPEIPLAAASMELFQAGLLVHDDIMDRDELRRGAPTIHARYAAELRERGIDEAPHVGEALGICLGDICYFEAYAALARALEGAFRADPARAGAAGRIFALCSSVLSEVAVAQMTDVSWGSGREEVPEEEILAMYRGKTAHYSFSLPLCVGALCAGGPDLVGPFMALGERLGVLFQIRDDELGLFGQAEAIGKGRGSDLREGKKTLFRARLLAAAPAAEQGRLRSLFGGEVEADAGDLAYLRRLAEGLGVLRGIAELSRRTEAEALTILDGLRGMPPGVAAVFEGLVEYVTRRER
jgi:geranylgeranyl diphosphate synthase type I